MEEGRTGAADGRAIRRTSRVRARNGPANSSTTSVSAQQHPRDDRPNGDDVDARLPSRGTVRPADASIDAGCTVDQPVLNQPAREGKLKCITYLTPYANSSSLLRRHQYWLPSVALGEVLTRAIGGDEM